jgi:hypothetical protein
MTSLARILQSRGAFCGLVALALVALRVIIFDYHFFQRDSLPNHDMGDGIAFFATSMHSVRLTGDIAWWNPLTDNGYPQYYQTFFFPLAPTSHHIVFILWTQVIRVLGLLGIAVPEYSQYLAVNYLILPFLTFFGLSLFASFLFRRRLSVLLVALTYAFSGIGLWQSAWFYFQESSSLFFVLAAHVAALQRPNRQRLSLLVLAILLQVTSINYWTLYNFFFVVILLGSYCWIHPNQLRRLSRRVLAATRRPSRSTLFASGMVGALLVTWLVMLHSIIAEQRDTFVRREEGNSFSIQEVYELRPDIRACTVNLFDPVAPANILANPMHYARYVGCALVPLLLLALLRRWRRQEQWLLASAAGIFIICMAPPVVLQIWESLPMMHYVRHIFRFYPHHLALVIVLLAGSGFDGLLAQNSPSSLRKRLRVGSAALGAFLVLLLLIGASMPSFQLSVPFVVLTLAAVILVGQVLLAERDARQGVCATLLLLLTFSDLTRYFWETSSHDAEFTHYAFGYPQPMLDTLSERLRRPWSNPDLTKGSEAGVLLNLPIANPFWPRNLYMRSSAAIDAELVQKASMPNRLLDGEPIEFYQNALVVETPQRAAELFAGKPAPVCDKDILMLQQPPGAADLAGQTTAMPAAAPKPKAPYQMRMWTYNAFAFDVSAPDDGWLLVHQLYDPQWKVTVDGVVVAPLRANFAGMAVRVARGRHVLHLDYWPRARHMYWWSCLFLEATVVILGTQAFRKTSANRLCRIDENQCAWARAA